MKNIDFTRKIMTEDTLRMMKATVLSKDVLSGSAVHTLIEDLSKLRSLCTSIVTSYNNNKSEDVIKGIEFLRMVL